MKNKDITIRTLGVAPNEFESGYMIGFLRGTLDQHTLEQTHLIKSIVLTGAIFGIEGLALGIACKDEIFKAYVAVSDFVGNTKDRIKNKIEKTVFAIEDLGQEWDDTMLKK